MAPYHNLPLRDIHLPDPISWWPIAPGWWLLLACTIILFITTILITKKLLKSTLKKQAIKSLDHIENEFQTHGDATQCIRAISEFLRRVVLSSTPTPKNAGLTGMAWLTLLDEKLDKPEFSQGAGLSLLSSPYQHEVDHDDATQLIKLCRKWIKRL